MAWLPKRCVVVPVDLSDESIGALDTALQLVESPAAVHVIHVLPKLEPTEPGVVWNTITDPQRRKHAAEVLRQRFADDKYRGVDLVVDIGDPGSQIADFAQSVQADLVVLPSHGRTGIARLLIGSVAERVVRLSHCPVLVLRN